MPVEAKLKRQGLAYENRKLRDLIEALRGDRDAATVDIKPMEKAPIGSGWAEMIVTLGGTGDEHEFSVEVASRAFVYWLVYERERLRNGLKVIEEALADMGVDASKIKAKDSPE